MSPDSFISALVEVVHQASVNGTVATLLKPAGRTPAPRLVELSAWYHRLTAEDQAHLRQVVEQAVHATLFGCLCVLDGVSAIEETEEKSELQLTAVSGNSQERLNSPDAEDLHDKYQGLVYERVFGQPP